jgi:hypothetical protein
MTARPDGAPTPSGHRFSSVGTAKNRPGFREKYRPGAANVWMPAVHGLPGLMEPSV